MHFRLNFFHGRKHYGPWSDCSQWEQSDLGPYCCNIDNLRVTTYADEKMDDTSNDWRANV